MVGTGEALLSIRAKGGPAAQPDGKGAATVSTAQEFDFQGELQKFDKVGGMGWAAAATVTELSDPCTLLTHLFVR